MRADEDEGGFPMPKSAHLWSRSGNEREEREKEMKEGNGKGSRNALLI